MISKSLIDKSKFVSEEFIKHIRSINPSTKPVFGKMNFHQMVEHMNLSLKQANGKILFINNQTEEETAKMYRFAMSSKPFKDNTPNNLLPDNPLPIKYETIEESIQELQQEIDSFNEVFRNNENKRITNPFFGDLNYTEWCHLLYKHMIHHLRQFNVMITNE